MSTSQLIANRFKIGDPAQDRLGRGGMGKVYRAPGAVLLRGTRCRKKP